MGFEKTDSGPSTVPFVSGKFVVISLRITRKPATRYSA
jgi:hypothetical protein